MDVPEFTWKGSILKLLALFIASIVFIITPVVLFDMNQKHPKASREDHFTTSNYLATTQNTTDVFSFNETSEEIVNNQTSLW